MATKKKDPNYEYLNGKIVGVMPHASYASGYEQYVTGKPKKTSKRKSSSKKK